MKRAFLSMLSAVTLMYFLLGSLAFAQGEWTTSGNNIYNSNSGNVGIGTNAPDRQFHIKSATSGYPTLKVEANYIGAAAGSIEFHHNPSDNSIIDGDNLGTIGFYGLTDTGVSDTYAYILGEATDVSNGATAGSIQFQINVNGT